MNIKLSFLASILTLLISANINAQKLSLENTYDFPGINASSNLANVEYNPTDKTTTLHYVAKYPFHTQFDQFVFNEKLEYVRTESKQYTMVDMMKDDFMNQYTWFKFSGENYSRQSLWVYRNLRQEIIAKQVVYNYKWNWTLGGYTRRAVVGEKAVIKGIDGGRLFLYDRLDNSETGEVIAITGLRRAKGDKDKSKVFQQARKFQFIKIKTDFTSEIIETIDFPSNMGVKFH